MRWLRPSIASFVVLIALNAAALTVPTPAAAWSAACGGGTSNLFLGNGKSASGLIGVYSEIQFTERSLCLQGPPGAEMPSWALSWVSIDGPQDDQTPGIDIYQGGYAKCPSDRVGSCPYNNGTSYIWHYYAHEQGACGLAYNTGFRYDMDVSSGFHDFQVSKVSGRYRFYVDEVQEGSRDASDIETCWPGIVQVEWQNEMLNTGDQGGGPVSNHQDFRNNQYQNGTGWHNMNRTLSADCDANSYPAHWHCHTTSTTANTFKSWDDRAP